MKRKYFGGYLSLRQMLYMIFSVISLGVLFLPVIPIGLKIILFILIFGVFMTFAFLKIGTTYADRYFLNIVKYIFRNKIFINER